MNRMVDVDGWQLTMPVGGQIWNYDKWEFYRNPFQSFTGSCKAIDAVALDVNGTLWLIELKDYEQHSRQKPSSVFAEVATKVRDTLAGLASARVNADLLSGERDLADAAMHCRHMRVVLQLAQPVKPSRLHPQVIDPSDARDKLRQVLRAVDKRAVCVVGGIAGSHQDLPWTTARLRSNKG